MTDTDDSGEIYPSEVQRAYTLHNRYLNDLDAWRQYRDEHGQEVVIWSSIYYLMQSADGMDADLGEMREAVKIPEDLQVGESITEVLGFDKDTSVSDLIEGNISLKDQLVSQGDWPPFVEEGQELTRKRKAVERSARNLRNHLFFGGSPSDIESGTRCAFQESFGRLQYSSQVTVAKKLTEDLSASQMGRQILAHLVDTEPSASEKPRTFRVLYLFDPTPIWNGHFSDNIVNPPEKSTVENDDSAYLAMDASGTPYVRDLKFANTLIMLAGQVMPGVMHYQVREQGDLRSGNVQLAMMVYMIDGGLGNSAWKRFKRQGAASDAANVFGYLGDALGTGADIIEQFESDSRSRYQVSAMESASRAAKLRRYRQYSSNFAGLMTLVGTTVGALAKANEDQLEFTVGGAYNAAGGVVDLADLYSGFRDIAGANYDSVELRDGKYVKYSLDSDDATKTVGKTMVDWAGRAFEVIDVFISGWTAYTAFEEGEYDVMILAGIGIGLAIAGIFAGGWVAVILAIAGIVVGYLQSWVSTSDVTKWIERTIFGDTEVSASQNDDPNSRWFGYNGYKRIAAPADATDRNGLSRQISGFYNLLTPFTLDGDVKIRESGGTYSCSFTLQELTMGSVGSGFLLQPIYHENGGYRVGPVAHDIISVMRVEQGGERHYVGNDGTSGGLDLTVEPTFEGPASSVSDPRKPMEAVQISLSNASSVAAIFGLSRNQITDPNGAFLEVLHVPGNSRSFVRQELSQAFDRSPTADFVDTVMDNQPYPRQRSALTIV